MLRYGVEVDADTASTPQGGAKSPALKQQPQQQHSDEGVSVAASTTSSAASASAAAMAAFTPLEMASASSSVGSRASPITAALAVRRDSRHQWRRAIAITMAANHFRQRANEQAAAEEEEEEEEEAEATAAMAECAVLGGKGW